MELRGEIKGISYNLAGKPLITFEIDRMADVNNISTLQKDEKLKIKITKQGSNRTVYQNSFKWQDVWDKRNNLPSLIEFTIKIPGSNNQEKIYQHTSMVSF